MIFYLIRHAKSLSNDLQEWTGQRDVSLSQDGIAELKKLATIYSYPKGEIYFSSPLLRCTESLKIIYDQCENILLTELSECSLGVYEGKKYNNLDDDPLYLAWLNHPDTPLENGESFNTFKTRAEMAFEKMIAIAAEKEAKTAVAMMHGNVMRAILHRFADSSISHNEWPIPNGGCYMLDVDDKMLHVNSWATLPGFLFEATWRNK